MCFDSGREGTAHCLAAAQETGELEAKSWPGLRAKHKLNRENGLLRASCTLVINQAVGLQERKYARPKSQLYISYI